MKDDSSDGNTGTAVIDIAHNDDGMAKENGKTIAKSVKDPKGPNSTELNSAIMGNIITNNGGSITKIGDVNWITIA